MSDRTEKSPLELTEMLESIDYASLTDQAVIQRILNVQAYAYIEILRELRTANDRNDIRERVSQ